ncbi:uncharacterized protein LOC133197022 [Saccostrea echinata]|uniref:uncharacterized protein LOC133197022 n=1 Tax=Saccostrea echinata TaxID=191078 RepID=UPI002A7FB8A7|nr:uncharacterized protein LOC133197022 [Saccostrea echinata]
MTTPEYIHLVNTSTVWICSACNSPNSSKIYNFISVEENTYNSFSALNSDIPYSPFSSIGSPCATSSPVRDHSPPKQQKRKSLTVVSLNFQSIKNKVHETEVLIDNLESDIIVGTETYWLNDNIFSAVVIPTTYNVFRRDRADSHGGIIIAVKNDLVCTPVYTSKDHELLCVRLQVNKKKSIIIGAYYRPPNITCENNAFLAVAEMSKVRSDHPKCDFWMAGDFNHPDINWSTQSIISHQYPSKMSTEYLNIPGDCGVEQLVCTPTRGDKILDLFFTSNPSLVQRRKVIPGVGDHDAVLLDSLIQPLRSKPARREIYSWDKADMTSLRKSSTTLYKTLPLDFSLQLILTGNSLETLLGIRNRHVPHKLTRSRTSNPWINTASRRLARWKLRAFHKAKATKKQRDQQRYLSLKSECQRTIRLAYQQYVKDIITPSA